AHFNYGLALASLGRLEEAIEQHLQAVYLKPEHAENQFALADLLVRENKFEDATLHFSQAIKYKPGYVEAHLQLALALHQLGKVSEAVEQYEETLRLKPDEVEVINNLAWIYATYPDSNIRNGTRAVELAKFACQL